MEPEVAQPKNSVESQLHRVTPLSKYLALTLFVALPFIGGWIGYTHAPEKVVVVEKVIDSKASDIISDSEISYPKTIEVERTLSISSPALQFILADKPIECSTKNFFDEQIKVGDVINGLKVTNIEPINPNEKISNSNMSVTFEGSLKLVGIPLWANVGDDLFLIDEVSARKLPCHSSKDNEYPYGLQLLKVNGNIMPWYERIASNPMTIADPYLLSATKFIVNLFESRYEDGVSEERRFILPTDATPLPSPLDNL
jgi:hypothetical protein